VWNRVLRSLTTCGINLCITLIHIGDKIVVLDKGGVQEEGTHLELLAHKGLYHNLWTKQGGGQ